MASSGRVKDFALRVTFPGGDPGEDGNKLLQKWMKEVATKWVFQLERGSKKGYHHFQGALRLHNRTTPSILRKRFFLAFEVEKEVQKLIDIKPLSNEGSKGGAFNYCMKADTRVRGPWRDESAPNEMGFEGWFMPSLEEMWPWQKDVYKVANDAALSGQVHNRHVNVIYDQEGGHGKSTLMRKLLKDGLAAFVPVTDNWTIAMQAMMEQKGKRTIAIDLPRAMDKKQEENVWKAIEKLKDGILWDWRYKFKMVSIPPCEIIVFTNSPPDLTKLSRDRWVLWYIDVETMELSEMAPEAAGGGGRGGEGGGQ